MKVTSVVIVFLASLAPSYGFTSYLDQMSGGAPAAVKKASFGPSGGGKPMAPAKGPASYLDNIAGAAAATPPPPPPAAPVASAPPAASAAPAASAPAVADYLSSLRTESAPSGSGFATYLGTLPSSSAPSGSGFATYLGTLPSSGAPSGSGPQGYLDVVGGGKGSALKSSTFAPSKSSPSQSAPSSSSSSSSGGGNNAVLDAIGNLNNNMRKNQQATIDVLKDISAGVKILVEKTEAKAAAAGASVPAMQAAPAGTPWQ